MESLANWKFAASTNKKKILFFQKRYSSSRANKQQIKSIPTRCSASIGTLYFPYLLVVTVSLSFFIRYHLSRVFWCEFWAKFEFHLAFDGFNTYVAWNTFLTRHFNFTCIMQKLCSNDEIGDELRVFRAIAVPFSNCDIFKTDRIFRFCDWLFLPSECIHCQPLYYYF